MVSSKQKKRKEAFNSVKVDRDTNKRDGDIPLDEDEEEETPMTEEEKKKFILIPSLFNNENGYDKGLMIEEYKYQKYKEKLQELDTH